MVSEPDPLDTVDYEVPQERADSGTRIIWTLFGPLAYLGGQRLVAPDLPPSATVPGLLVFMFLGYAALSIKRQKPKDRT